MQPCWYVCLVLRVTLQKVLQVLCVWQKCCRQVSCSLCAAEVLQIDQLQPVHNRSAADSLAAVCVQQECCR